MGVVGGTGRGEGAGDVHLRAKEMEPINGVFLEQIEGPVVLLNLHSRSHASQGNLDPLRRFHYLNRDAAGQVVGLG